jgi:phospholipid/cholesterol/gamma-HCH transport system substrate-binding protein
MMKYKKEEIKAGLVVIAALLIFSAVAILIGGSRFWEELNIYQVRFSAIGGLETGAAVRLGGYRVGRVVGIRVAPDDISKIEVTIGVKRETPIYRGVLAGVYTLGLVGDYYVLLTQQPGATEPLPLGSEIASRDMVEMGDLLAQAAELSQTLNASIEGVVSAIDRTLSEENIEYLQMALQGISRLTTEGEKNISTITADLRVVLTRMNTLIGDMNNLMVENKDDVRSTVTAIRSLAERVDELSLNLNQILVENREDVRATMTAFKKDSQKAGELLDHLDGRIGVTGDYLDETMVNLMEVSENLRLLSGQLRRQPWRLIYRERSTE